MSTLRCWPSALAKIVRSTCGNERRRVVVLRDAQEGDDGWLAYPKEVGKLWAVQPLQPLTAVITFGGFVLGRRQTVAVAVIPDAWLRPIIPPPSTATEIVADIIEAARGEPVEA